MNRGNQLRAIFRDDADRKVFLATLSETAGSAGWAVHSFVLMRNHYHLLIETQRPTSVKGMQFLNSTSRLSELAAAPREGDSWTGEAVEELEADRAMRLLTSGYRQLGYRSLGIGVSPISL